MCKLRQSMQGPSSDILSLHSSLFTEERNFCPRTLKSAASSRVRDLACYNPPKPKLSGECDFGKSRVNKDGNAHESNGRKIFDGPTRLNSPQSVKKSPKKKDRLKSIQQIAKQLNIPSKLIKELSSSICQPQNADSAFNKSRSVERIDGGQIAKSNAVSTGRKWSTGKSKSHHQFDSESETESEIEGLSELLGSSFAFTKKKSSSTNSTSEQSHCSMEQTGKLLSSLKIGKAGENAKQEEDYEDDFEDTTDNNESNEVDEEISSSEHDYSDESFEDDDGSDDE
ncbi:unnamed protein product [Hymenolepis diminuta]|uniref:Suppressor protein SRP40-like n=1 Tax=Hymenolepis diminuta TaxID=6216 RepID=A0A0R3SSE3_HYMDI|nr:unnamed protein product [Hymenolepis diminuta]